MNYQSRLLKAIPGGAHTYSRGFDQFSSNAPQILQEGKGAYVIDPAGNQYLDYGMALRSITLGYSNERVNLAASELSGVSAADSPAKLVGRQVGIVLSPLPSKKRQLKFSLPEDEIDESIQEE